MYVPSIKVNKTVLKSNGSGLNIIHANTLKIVLSNKAESNVEKLLRTHKNFFLVSTDIFS